MNKVKESLNWFNWIIAEGKRGVKTKLLERGESGHFTWVRLCKIELRTPLVDRLVLMGNENHSV